ncbi:MAG: hypothetical protein WDO15_10250 [Bacteroidota bacterium]
MVASAFAFFQAQTWKIAEGYSVKFDGGDPSGEFSGLKGTIQFDDEKISPLRSSILRSTQLRSTPVME